MGIMQHSMSLPADSPLFTLNITKPSFCSVDHRFPRWNHGWLKASVRRRAQLIYLSGQSPNDLILFLWEFENVLLAIERECLSCKNDCEDIMWEHKTYLETLVCRKIQPLKSYFRTAATWAEKRKKTFPGSFSSNWTEIKWKNCETINWAFFFYQCGTVWRRFGGGLPVLPATIFPSAFHSFCLSHFSINLHNLTLFIESGLCLLHRTNKMLPFCLPHNNLFLFPFSAALPLGGGISAQDAEPHGASQGLAGMRLYVSD